MTRHVLRPAACVFAAVVGTACVERPVPLGTIEVPLTAPGPDGGTYRLPFDTILFLDAPGFHGGFGLEGDAPSKTFEVAPGDYALSLVDRAGDTTVWPLTLEEPNGLTTTVETNLDLPATLHVTENETTEVVIRFHVPHLETITFAVGTVDVTVAVDDTSATSLDIEVGMDATRVLTTSVAPPGPSAPPALRTRLPATGDPGDRYLVRAHVVGPWAIARESVACAPARVSIDAGGNPGFVNLVAEAPPSIQPLCIQQDAPGRAEVSIIFTRQGAALTPLLSDFSALQYVINEGFFAVVDADLFDGRTLRLDTLAGVHVVQFVMFGEITAQIGTRSDGSPVTDKWYDLGEGGPVAMIVSPR